MLASAFSTFHSFAEIPILEIYASNSLQASSPIWASETSLARTRERAGESRGAGGNAPRPSLARSREARFACPNRKAMLVIM